jgi:uncharacterized protein YndB with AHSA1/START domain
MKRDLTFTRIYPHPPELVWRALTESDALGEWLMENDFVPRVGHRFQFHTEPAPGFDGVVNCEVLAVEEPTRLSFTWRGGPIDTILTFTLERVAEGTRLHMEQTGFFGLKAVVVSYILGTGFKSMYEKKLPALLQRMATGEWVPAPAAGCDTGDGPTAGAHVLAHLANIIPGSGGRDDDKSSAAGSINQEKR